MGQAMNFEKWYKTAKEKIGFPANAESLELSLREVVGEVLSQNLKLKTENKKLKAKLKDFEKMKNCSNCGHNCEECENRDCDNCACADCDKHSKWKLRK